MEEKGIINSPTTRTYGSGENGVWVGGQEVLDTMCPTH